MSGITAVPAAAEGLPDLRAIRNMLAGVLVAGGTAIAVSLPGDTPTDAGCFAPAVLARTNTTLDGIEYLPAMETSGARSTPMRTVLSGLQPDTVPIGAQWGIYPWPARSHNPNQGFDGASSFEALIFWASVTGEYSEPAPAFRIPCDATSDDLLADTFFVRVD